jgi:hypothetical protein
MEKIELVLEVFGKPHKVTIPDVVEIGEGTINKNICDQAGLYAFYGEALADARNKRDMCSQALKDTRAAIDLNVRKRTEESKAKTTEARIAAEVELNEQVVKLKDKLLALEGNVGKIEAIVRSFEHRKDMLVTLGANMRTDVEKGNMSGINKRQ